jgi:hypothetical protein
MKCAICGITVESIDDAVEEGWTPYFYEGEIEHEFACPDCAGTFLREGPGVPGTDIRATMTGDG